MRQGLKALSGAATEQQGLLALLQVLCESTSACGVSIAFLDLEASRARIVVSTSTECEEKLLRFDEAGETRLRSGETVVGQLLAKSVSASVGVEGPSRAKDLVTVVPFLAERNLDHVICLHRLDSDRIRQSVQGLRTMEPLVVVALRGALRHRAWEQGKNSSGGEGETKRLVGTLSSVHTPVRMPCDLGGTKHPLVAASLRSAKKSAREMASSLGKDNLDISIEYDWLRLDPVVWEPFFATWSYTIFNAIVHGIESAAMRLELGKSPGGQLTLRQQRTGAGLVFEVEDDGCGIDWEWVASRASALGIAHSNPEELVEALFTDELGPNASDSAIAHGAFAFRQTVKQLGGYLEVETKRGEGTCVRAVFEHPELASQKTFPP